MGRKKRQPTLARRVVLGWMVMVILSNLLIGILSYSSYKGQLYDARALEAQNVALAMAVRIDGDKFSAVLDTMEKNDYWYEIKEYADTISVVFQTAFIYILDDDYTDKVTYFAEGAPGDAPFDLGDTEIIEDIYADEMFDTLRTGEASCTDPYPSGDYGDMVSGFAAITDKSGNVVGVVGVDFYYENIQATLRSFAITLTAIILAFIVFCYFFMTYLGVKLAGAPLDALDKAAQRFAVGDMDIDLKIHSKSEIGRLANSFRQMVEGIKKQVAALEVLSQGDLTPQVEPRGDKDVMGIAIAQILQNLNNMLKEIQQSAANVSAGATQISDISQNLAQGAHEQAGAVDRLSSSISNVSNKANENLEIANKTNMLANSIKDDAQIGSGQMGKMTTAVQEITDASMSISKVIKVIDDIAFQTNILALNAAVEAARAGQHGKGFAVVAEEVRSLAGKSAEAAKDSERLILNSMDKAKAGVAIADETMASLNRIITGINECATLVGVITGAFNEQIEAMTQINEDIDQVAHIVQQNNATAEQSAAASEEMKGQAAILDELVSNFKLKGQDLPAHKASSSIKLSTHNTTGNNTPEDRGWGKY